MTVPSHMFGEYPYFTQAEVDEIRAALQERWARADRARGETSNPHAATALLERQHFLENLQAKVGEL